jgi:FkbM family methyltransferase
MLLRENGLRAARTGLVALRVKNPFRADVWLREPGTDIWTFREIVFREIYGLVAERVGRCEYVFDLGGNIGLTSLYLATRFPQCRILTVEPYSANCELLKKNLAPLIATGRCQVCPGAVWRDDTTLDLSLPPGGTGFDAIQVKAVSPTELRQPVPAFTVETLLRMANFPRIDVLKIDIEGAETALFRAPTAWLARVNAIAIEFHGNSRQESGFDAVVGAAGFMIEEDRFPNCVVAYRPTENRVE